MLPELQRTMQRDLRIYALCSIFTRFHVILFMSIHSTIN